MASHWVFLCIKAWITNVVRWNKQVTSTVVGNDSLMKLKLKVVPEYAIQTTEILVRGS